MKQYIKEHTREFLIGIDILILAVAIGTFALGISYISTEINRVVIFNITSQSSVSFNFKNAVNLNLKGLLQQ